MFIDSQLQFSSAQALTSTAASTNIVDLGVARNIQDGEAMTILVVPTVAADITTGDETYEFDVETATDAAFTSPVVVSKTTVAAALLTVGAKPIALPIPIGFAVLRYIRVKYVLGGTTPSLTASAYLEPSNLVEKRTIYKDNSTID